MRTPSWPPAALPEEALAVAFRDEPSDLYTLLEPLVAQRPESNTWVLVSSGAMQYFPDYTLLEAMLGVPIGEGSGSQSGRLAKATDA
jgi:hypothetical protein